MDIEKLKQKILDLAVRGKLVPQDPNDEPASVLVEKIRKEKEELIRQGKIKRDKNESYIYKGSDNCYYEKIGNDIKNITDELPFEIPNSWAWVRLKNLCNIKGGKRIPKGMSFSKIPTNHIYIRVSDMIDESISQEKLVYIDEDVFQYIKQYVINKDDLYVSIAGTIGKCGIVPAFFDNMNLTENAVKLTNILYNKLWLLIILTSNYGKEKMVEKVHQVAQPKLSITSLSDVLIPIPPLNESERIILYFNSYRKHISRIDCWKNEINGLIQKLKTKILEYYFGEDSCYKSYYKLEPISKYIKLISGRDLKTTDFNNIRKGIPYITGASNFVNNEILINRWTENPQVISTLNDILITCKGTIGKISINKIGDCHIARQIMAIKTKDKVEIKYLKYFLESKVTYLIRKSSSLIPGITREDILSLNIPIFDFKTQCEIVNKIDEYLKILDIIIS